MCMIKAWFKTQEKRKVTFKFGDRYRNLLCVDKEKTSTVYMKCECNPWGVSTCISGSRYG